ncbi:transglycosylase domain-containing protein [Synechococcus sp. CCY 9618]|uniref:transglycosylase domain-containing protein n=1 Tax=Synechococcus sp. CCY 9618 TaxID=2815602 RepID=UPI001C24A36C|nr:transglycosylase domain-containing protein [Synechococcus sp. CCY 9618]
MPTAIPERLEPRLRRRPPLAGARLELHSPGLQQRTHPLHGGCYRLGRASDNDIVIDHSAVSRRHALLENHGEHWLLSDEGSTNGLWWQGRRVRELLLRDGDRVRFGPDDQADLPTLLFRRDGNPAWKRLGRWAGPCAAGLAGAGILLLGLSLVQVPTRGSLATVRGPLLLYDRGDRPVASLADRKHRELASLEAYPPVLIEALLASEDNRFWWHPGVDPIGTARALLTNLLGGRVLEGGSTLTQQIARSLYPEQVGQGETLGRKWRELLVALQLEARFSKGELLLSYLNRVYLGAVWGFEDASRRFFARPAAALTLEEAALLVGLLPSPNGYDPCLDPAAALASRNRVLDKMATAGRIDADRARSARRQPIRLAADACLSTQGRGAPFYTDQVRRDLENLVGEDVAAEGNFLIDTHLNPALQERIELLLRQRIDASRSLGVSQGAVVVLDSRSGGIVAIAGGRDYLQSQFNRASMALRQPGSTFKLVPYLVALERGAKPGDRIGCGPLEWAGQRFASGCGGSLSLRQALAISSNTAALRLARKDGLDAIVRKGRDLGFTSPLAPVPGLALGQSEVTLLELTAAYAAVAAEGVWRPPTTIRRLTDAEACPGSQSSAGNGGADCRAAGARAVASPGRRVTSVATAKAMQSLLEAVVSGGTGRAADVGPGSWGKTGTTNEGRDLLFVGYVPRRHWVIGIWLGNDDNSPTAASSALAASLWGEIVRTAPPAP